MGYKQPHDSGVCLKLSKFSDHIMRFYIMVMCTSHVYYVVIQLDIVSRICSNDIQNHMSYCLGPTRRACPNVRLLIYCPHNSKISALFWTNPLCIYIYIYIYIKGSRLLLRRRVRRIQQLMQHPGNQCRSFFQAKITRCISPFSSQAQLSTFETTQNWMDISLILTCWLALKWF